MDTVQGNINFLEEAKLALAALDEATNRRQTLSTNEKRLEKLIASEEKTVADEIAQTVKKRKEEVGADYDRQISSVQERLRKLKQKKEKAKTAGMKERIKEETVDLSDQITELTNHYRTLFSQNRVPRICRGDLFFVFFMTHGIVQWLVVFLTAALLLFALPYGIYTVFDMQKPYMLSLLHFIFFAVIMGIYQWINAKIKYRYYDVLKQGLNIKNQIRFHRKKIRIITSSIRRDEDEERYDLGAFNYDIAKTEAEIEEIAAKKQEALSTFEAVTRRVIRDELLETNRERIQQLKAEKTANAEALAQAEELVKNRSIQVTNNYGGLLPKECLNGASIDRLIDMLKRGEATSISEAVSLYRSKKV